MLGQIAFNTFVNGEYFFRQEDLQRQIKEYICNLPEASADPDALRLDSEAVLKAIEHHHGLLVERARNIYSFSHLTFQEYFTAREIERERHFEILVQNISDPRWNEVFYLTAEMLRRSDDLLLLMKVRIDGMLTSDAKLQMFLEWINQKTNSVKFSYKPVAIRAFYAYIGSRDLNRAYALTSALNLNISPNPNLAQSIASARSLARDKSLDIALDLDLDRALALTNSNIDRNLAFFDRIRAYVIDITFAIKHTLTLTSVITRVHARTSDYLLLQSLQSLVSKLPTNEDDFYQWRVHHEEAWSDAFRQVCIDHRNIGHVWQFTDEQVELLNQYYEAHILLVKIMNRSYVNKQIREEIESTMLLPSKK